ncbi:MAG: MltA domain-containing protein [Planctomycetota bacterium]
METRRLLRVGLLGVGWVSLTLFGGCVQPPPYEVYEPVKNYARPLPPGAVALEKVENVRDYPSFAEGLSELESLEVAVNESLAYFAKPSSRKYYPYRGITHARAVQTLTAFLEDLRAATSGEDLDRRIRARYEVYRSVGCDGEGTVLFTGYFEPIYKGSRTPSDKFKYPLYRLPADVVKDPEGRPLGRRTAGGRIVPYYTKREIEEQGLLAGKGLELAYLEGPFEAYLVRVQGSARILLPGGEVVRVGYAGKTDRPWQSVSQLLVRDGKLKPSEQSLQAARRYFAVHPDELQSYLWEDESYVFFRETEGGPFGSINAAVTAMRTLATDKDVFPRGCLAFVDTQIPDAATHGRSARPFKAFTLDQDTGGAIRSAGRADIFMGTGEAAESIAGGTKYEGRLYYLFLKPELATEMAEAVP